MFPYFPSYKRVLFTNENTPKLKLHLQLHTFLCFHYKNVSETFINKYVVNESMKEHVENQTIKLWL